MRRHSTRPAPRMAPGKRGFTLLEVLLALALSVAVMAGVYSAMNMYRRASTAGRVEMERYQLARAVLRQMALDIRSVVYRDPTMEAAPVQAAEEGLTDGLSTEGEMTVGLEDLAGGAQGRTVGVYGTPGWLVLHVSRPTRAATHSDLKSITYVLGTGQGAGLEGMLAPGLNRLEGDLLTMSLADERGDVATLAAHARLLAEEVQWLEFQYFDGVQWRFDWDSDRDFGPPLAIRIGLVLSAVPEPYRLTVSLPIAPPYVGAY